MRCLAYILALIVLTPDWAWSGGSRGNRGAVRASAGFVRSGSTATVRPRLGAFSHSVVGNPIFIPHSHHSGIHFRRRSFVRFTLAPAVIQPFYPPFIYYHPYPYQPWWNRYGYFPYQPGALIIEVPAVSDSTLSSSIMPHMPMEHFAPAPLLDHR